MNTNQSDLIAIANADLAQRLNQSKEPPSEPAMEDSEHSTNEQTGLFHSFQDDVWKALYTLNLFRYGTGIVILIMLTSSSIEGGWRLIEQLLHPGVVFACAITLLASAVVFSYTSERLKQHFGLIVSVQFSLDLILAAALTHSTGSLQSSFMLLYMVVVATGSVVLPKRKALGLAAGAVILMFFEHSYSVWSSHTPLNPNYSLLANSGIFLFALSLLVSWLAQRIREAELQSFTPGQESIEDYLVREETEALRAALKQTNGNKTEAAKLLGMTFRSFRYKVTKYNID